MTDKTEPVAVPVAMTDAMAYAFHNALTDGPIGADEVEEIKKGLSAAFAQVERYGDGTQPVAVPVAKLITWLNNAALPDPYDERPVMNADKFSSIADTLAALQAERRQSESELETAHRVIREIRLAAGADVLESLIGKVKSLVEQLAAANERLEERGVMLDNAHEEWREMNIKLAAANLRERELRELLNNAIEAIRVFRCEPMLRDLIELRKTPGYAGLESPRDRALAFLSRPTDDSALDRLEAGYQAQLKLLRALLSNYATDDYGIYPEEVYQAVTATPTEALDRYVAEKVAQAKNDAYKEDGLIIDHLKKEHAEQVKHQWRCFHCNEVFIDQKSATEHFGTSQFQAAACQIDIAEYRRMEEVNRRHLEDDTDLHRALHQAVIDGDQKAQKAEEEGYAKGLKAGMAEQVKKETDRMIGVLRRDVEEPGHTGYEPKYLFGDGVAACIAALEQVKARESCPYCDGTGDVHRADGEWLGVCSNCEAGKARGE